jgi:hypothetical protein
LRAAGFGVELGPLAAALTRLDAGLLRTLSALKPSVKHA